VGVAISLDLVDRRLYTVNEAERLMGMPAAGWQLQDSGLSSQVFARQQSRRFASTLIRNKSRTAKNVFSFSSVKAAGSATAVILDSAAELQRLGHRVLVLEANSFAPSPSFDASRPGLSDYLAGHADAAHLAQAVSHQGETLTAVGFGAELMAGVQRLDRLKPLIAAWSNEYEFVLIDLPPLLLSADAELLIDALGQVFLVLQAQAVGRGEVLRAKRLLEKLDPEAVGLFVSDIPMFDGGGYVKELMVETLTREPFSRFMSLSNLRLQVELLRAHWLQMRMKRTRPPGKLV
jgi:Mrp family chromosome partitioning ATPase